MTDAHCHVSDPSDGATRRFLCDPTEAVPAPGDVRFLGVHPWAVLSDAAPSAESAAARLAASLAADPRAGVGEIGLDRLKERAIPEAMRALFDAQLRVAARFARPVVLHGAKCWGEVVRGCRPYADRIPAFLFHGFSRSGGLLGEMASLNGFVSVGPALLNDHAVNYRALVRALPADRLLVESDRTATAAVVPSVAAVAAKLAELRGVAADALEAQLEANAARFLAGIS